MTPEEYKIIMESFRFYNLVGLIDYLISIIEIFCMIIFLYLIIYIPPTKAEKRHFFLMLFSLTVFIAGFVATAIHLFIQLVCMQVAQWETFNQSIHNNYFIRSILFLISIAFIDWLIKIDKTLYSIFKKYDEIKEEEVLNPQEESNHE